MGAPFPRWANTAFPLFVACGVAFVALVLVGLMVIVRTPYVTQETFTIDQPVEFDHRHHVLDDRIDCEYCHFTARTSPTAGIPTAEMCMGCHAQVWNDSPLLEPVRQAYFTGQPIRWRRVHNVGDFVFFNHSIHVTAGIDCSRCHGAVERMGRVRRVAPLTMGWCLDCHADPAGQGATRRGIPHTTLTTCTACHR